MLCIVAAETIATKREKITSFVKSAQIMHNMGGKHEKIPIFLSIISPQNFKLLQIHVLNIKNSAVNRNDLTGYKIRIV